MKMVVTKTRLILMLGALAFASLFLAAVAAAAHDFSRKDEAGAVVAVRDAEKMRILGEQRFHANCGRCHAAPQKFPPRMMKTVLRHMRVRATITDEDMRLVLFYMTQ
jgi:cytochrome c5